MMNLLAEAKTVTGNPDVSEQDDQGSTTRITPHRGWLDWRLGQLWRYRDLIGLFVWRDFVSIYGPHHQKTSHC